MYNRTYYIINSSYHPDGERGRVSSRSKEARSLEEAYKVAAEEERKNEYFVGDAYIDNIRITEVVEQSIYTEIPYETSIN